MHIVSIDKNTQYLQTESMAILFYKNKPIAKYKDTILHVNKVRGAVEIHEVNDWINMIDFIDQFGLYEAGDYVVRGDLQDVI